MSKKDVIYIDIEDDITAIIDKVKMSKAEIVALVPPKRSTVLQSAVNMKLLKRAADKDHKKIVLISSEPSLMPLAGGVGLFMADSLQSRPKIPAVEKPDIDESVIEADDLVDEEIAKDASPEVGAVAVIAAEKADKPVAAAKNKSKKAKEEKIKPLKSNSSKIPNFSKFRKRIIFGCLAVVGLIVLWFVCFNVLPKATIVVQAQTTRVPVDTTFLADAGSQTNIDQGVLAAQQQTLTKTATVEFDATGEKDVGKKASGNITVQNCYSSTELSVPAGTVFTDPSTGNQFTSDTAVDVPGAVFFGGCTSPGEETVGVTAVESGDDKNLSPRSYSVAGYGTKVTGYGDQMSGGTTKKVKVVSQADVDAATKKLNERPSDEEKKELTGQFDESAYVIAQSFAVAPGAPTSAPAVGAEASKATLSSTFNYTMLAVNRDDLNKYLEKVEKEQLGESQQAILDSGIDQASISIPAKESETKMTIGVKTNGFAGPDFDEEAIKQEVKGKRYSEALSIIEGKEGVQNVSIDLSPFWVSHAPSNTSKINISIEVSENNLQ